MGIAYQGDLFHFPKLVGNLREDWDIFISYRTSTTNINDCVIRLLFPGSLGMVPVTSGEAWIHRLI